MAKSNTENEQWLSLEEARSLFYYEPDTGKITRKNTRASNAPEGSEAGWNNGNGYRRITIRERRFFAHRLAWFLHYGEWPNKEVDHVNGDRSDNRISNMRMAEHRENACNTKLRADNTSGYKGVTRSKGKTRWTAAIQIHGKGRSLGVYDTKEEAAAVYASAAAFYFREFANPVSKF